MKYEHTQKGHLHWLLFATAAVCVVGGVMVTQQGEGAWAAWLLYGSAVLIAALAFCFFTLTIRDEGEGLRVIFGPLPIFRTFVPYAGISKVAAGRSRLIDGLGVHWVPGRGWTWNLWGFACVELTVDGKPFRIGTDDGEALVSYLQSRLAGDAPSS